MFRGGTPLYKPYRYVPPQVRLFLLLCFGLKTGIDFTHFSLESDKVFLGTTGVSVISEGIRRFISK